MHTERGREPRVNSHIAGQLIFNEGQGIMGKWGGLFFSEIEKVAAPCVNRKPYTSQTPHKKCTDAGPTAEMRMSGKGLQTIPGTCIFTFLWSSGKTRQGLQRWFCR